MYAYVRPDTAEMQLSDVHNVPLVPISLPLEIRVARPALKERLVQQREPAAVPNAQETNIKIARDKTHVKRAALQLEPKTAIMWVAVVHRIVIVQIIKPAIQ